MDKPEQDASDWAEPCASASALLSTGGCVALTPRWAGSATALCQGQTFVAASSDLKLLQTPQCWAARISAPLILLPYLLLGLLFANSVISYSSAGKRSYSDLRIFLARAI